MLDEKVVANLRNRYSNVHPLLFHRSLERSKTVGGLFDLLDTMPTTYPIIWDEAAYRWVTTDDLLQSKDFSLGESKQTR